MGCDDGDDSDDDGVVGTAGIATTNPEAESSGSETGDAADSGGGPTGAMTSDSGGIDSTGGPAEDTGPAPMECDEPALPAASFATDIYTPIIAERCSCHVVGVQSGLAMPDAPTALLNLVDMVAASELPLVVAGDRDASYLWAKVNGTADDVRGGGGGQMPLGMTLACNELEAFGAWIDAGAAP